MWTHVNEHESIRSDDILLFQIESGNFYPFLEIFKELFYIACFKFKRFFKERRQEI